MTRTRDPAAMTAEERLVAIAKILAAGHLRLQVSRGSAQNPLDERRASEAPCDAKALNPKSENAA